MDLREITGCLMALGGAGLAASSAFGSGMERVCLEVPFLRPLLMAGAITGMVVLVLGLWLAADGECRRKER